MAAAEEHYKTCEALCCQHCGFAQANPEELANHVEVHCTKRIIICENGCGAEVPAGKLEAHFLACTKRLVPCGFAACDYMGSFDAMPQHEQTCAFRTSGTADPNFLLHDATKAHSKSFSTSSSMPQQEPNQRKHPARNVSFFGVSSPRRVQEPAKDGPGVAFQEATTL
ncbi:hypothetical protein DFJ74DRAFT_688167 [Hyaloraphidium curvatum]|nr:hypothetical protein DFJ74DRAFT_688167 [Hyaloraphidium curvatum]